MWAYQIFWWEPLVLWFSHELVYCWRFMLLPSAHVSYTPGLGPKQWLRRHLRMVRKQTGRIQFGNAMWIAKKNTKEHTLSILPAEKSSKYRLDVRIDRNQHAQCWFTSILWNPAVLFGSHLYVLQNIVACLVIVVLQDSIANLIGDWAHNQRTVSKPAVSSLLCPMDNKHLWNHHQDIAVPHVHQVLWLNHG